jgi:hypothetical protein
MAISSQADFIKSFGRFGDNFLAHVSKDERVLPPEGVLPEGVDRDINASMRALGASPARYTVGSDSNSINPITGQPEFFIGKALSGIFGSDRDPTKRQRQAIEEVRPLYASYKTSPGAYEDIMGKAFWDRTGAGVRFAPEQEDIYKGWADYMGQADRARARRMAEQESLFAGGPFGGGQVAEFLRVPFEHQSRLADRATANTLSRLFNTGGMSTGTAAQAGEYQRALGSTLAELKNKRLMDFASLREGYEGQRRGFESDVSKYQSERQKLLNELRQGLIPAQGISRDESAADRWRRGNEADLIMQNAALEDQKRMSETSIWDRIGSAVDLGLGVYGMSGGFGGGGGGTFGSLLGGSGAQGSLSPSLFGRLSGAFGASPQQYGPNALFAGPAPVGRPNIPYSTPSIQNYYNPLGS